MDLILWRHAEAEESAAGIPDSLRKLTTRGQKQAHQMAEWLKVQRLHKVQVFCSPAERAVQTAKTLGWDYKIKQQLTIGASAVELLAAADWPDHPGAVILIGHQPAMGRLAALLLAGHEADWTIKKGGIWWFTNRVRHDETQTVLRAVSNP